MKGSRLLATAVAALLPAVAFGQTAAPSGASVAAAFQAAGANGKSADTELALQARSFFNALLQKDVENLVPKCKAPFYFEGQLASSVDELKHRWSTMLQAKALDDTMLRGLQIMTPEQMTERYGKPPERLAAWPMKGGMISLANVDGHAVVVLWKKNGNTWQAIAFHD